MDEAWLRWRCSCDQRVMCEGGGGARRAPRRAAQGCMATAVFQLLDRGANASVRAARAMASVHARCDGFRCCSLRLAQSAARRRLGTSSEQSWRSDNHGNSRNTRAWEWRCGHQGALPVHTYTAHTLLHRMRSCTLVASRCGGLTMQPRCVRNPRTASYHSMHTNRSDYILCILPWRKTWAAPALAACSSLQMPKPRLQLPAYDE